MISDVMAVSTGVVFLSHRRKNHAPFDGSRHPYHTTRQPKTHCFFEIFKELTAPVTRPVVTAAAAKKATPSRSVTTEAFLKVYVG